MPFVRTNSDFQYNKKNYSSNLITVDWQKPHPPNRTPRQPGEDAPTGEEVKDALQVAIHQLDKFDFVSATVLRRFYTEVYGETLPFEEDDDVDDSYDLYDEWEEEDV